MSIANIGPKPSFASSLAVQLRVIRALMIREAQSHYSVETLGFFWTIAEPLVLTCGVILLWWITTHDKAHSEIGIVPLAVTGYSHIQLWRMTVSRSIHGIRSSSWLLYHHNVQVLDVLIARGLMISVSIFTSFTLISSVAILFGFMDPIRDPGLILAAWGLDTSFAMSFGMVIAGLTELSEFIEKLVHPFLYLTLMLTGTWGMTYWFPPKLRFILEWSPLANCVEMMRAGVFSLSIKTFYSAPYVAVSSLILFTIGLPLISYARRQAQIQ